MPNFEGIPILYKIKDITKRLFFGVPRVPHEDVPQDATSIDIFWTTLKIKNIVKRLFFSVPMVPHKDVPQDATSLDIFWTKLKIKKLWRRMHVVLSWINLDYFMHVHRPQKYFVETPNTIRKEYTVNDPLYEKQKLEGSVQLYINGLRQFIDQDYEETSIGIRLIGDTVIKATDFAWCHFRKIAVGEEEINV